MGRVLPPLNALKAFEAAARHRSFTLAARELSVTPSAVSQQVRALEERLSVTLFERRNNNLELTETGRAYLPFISAAFDQVARATSTLSEADDHERVVVQVMPTFGERWLLPRLPFFRQAFPDIRLQLTTSWRAVRIRHDAQIVIWYGEGDFPSFECDQLFPEVLVPVASPALLGRNAPLPTAEALSRCPRIQVTTTPEVWPIWLKDVGLQDEEKVRGPTFDTCGLAIQAAVHGLGVMMANRAFVGAELEAGTLLEAFPHRLRRDVGWHACRPAGSPETASARRFRQWLGDQARAVGDAGHALVPSVG